MSIIRFQIQSATGKNKWFSNAKAFGWKRWWSFGSKVHGVKLENLEYIHPTKDGALVKALALRSFGNKRLKEADYPKTGNTLIIPYEDLPALIESLKTHYGLYSSQQDQLS